MMEEKKTTSLNRAKPYQLVLFPMNNGATNVYYILTMNFIAYYANGVLGLALMFAIKVVLKNALDILAVSAPEKM